MNTDRSRMKRKDEHLELSSLGYGTAESWFEYVRLIHQSINEISIEEVDIRTHLSGLSLESLLIIDAITGGSPVAAALNRKLARIAGSLRLPISAGSQSIVFDFPDDAAVANSFKVIRQENPTGIVIANMPGSASSGKVQAAVDLLEANCVQLHLNPAQELFMQEGDRDFKGIIRNIKTIAANCNVPVIIKETGCGLSKETAARLFNEAGIDCFNVAGSGGSNFIAIENARNGKAQAEIISQWGIPTAASLLDMKSLAFNKTIIASGGIDTPLKAVKSLVLGADAIACAGWMLRLVNEFDTLEAIELLTDFIEDIKKLILLSGAKDIASLHQVGFILTGPLKDWADQRKNNKGGYTLNEN